MVAGNPDQPIKYKAFHNRISNDHAAIKKEKESYKGLPVVRKRSKEEMYKDFMGIKQDAQDIVDAVLEQVLNDPGLNVIQKANG